MVLLGMKQWTIISAFICSSRFITARPFNRIMFIPSHTQERRSTKVSSSSSTTNDEQTPTTILEIEQKFAITPESSSSTKTNTNDKSSLASVEKNLSSLGFEQVTKKKFMDWYFDIDSPYWILSVNNNFLRFRQPCQSEEATKVTTSSNNNGYDPDKGIWQLKRGYESNARERTTVYQEIEGEESIYLALSLIHEKCNENIIDKLQQQASPSSGLGCMDGYTIPIVPSPSSGESNDDNSFKQLASTLIPYARIETIRSSWKWNNTTSRVGSNSTIGTYEDLTVDLDGTDFGHMVGEVEAIAHSQDEIQDAKKAIQELIHKITYKDDEMDGANEKSTPALGKLETYMIMNRKDQYDACVKSGTM